MLQPVFSGFMLGGSLIAAIGAQNAFVIRQSALGLHVFWLCLFCSLADALLIWSGVFGLAAVIALWPWFVPVMTYGGVLFLVFYGIKAALRAVSPTGMGADGDLSSGLLAALLACAGFTFLNPHVYLDTVIFVGSIANARPKGEQHFFAVGATLASFTWFFAIGYGARALGPWLRRPRVWQVIDGLIALIMFGLAAKLLLG